jgi:hypothetical protein
MKKHLILAAVLGVAAYGSGVHAEDVPSTQPAQTEEFRVGGGSGGGGGSGFASGSSGNGPIMIRANGTGPGAMSFSSVPMKMRMEKSAWLGVMTSPAPEAMLKQLKLKCGLVVVEVIPDSPAAQAGLKRDDLLEKMDDQLLVNPAQFQSLVHMHNPGESAGFTLLHEGDRREATVKFVEHEVPIAPEFGGSFSGGGEFNPTTGMPFFVRVLNGPTTLHARPGSGIIGHFESRMDDGKFALTLDRQGDSRVLTIKDASGKEIFNGPVDTAEQQAKIPADLQARFHEMQKMQEMTGRPGKP